MFRQAVKYVCAIAGFLVITGIAAPSAAAAQGVDFAAGYSFLRDNELANSGEVSGNLAKGIFASLGVGVGPWLSLVGEVASNRRTFDELGTEIELKVDFYGAGVRVRGRSGAARPYGQVLFGAARGRLSGFGLSESGSEFAWQPGAGVDAYFSRSVGLRFGVNGRFIQAEDLTAKEFQVIVGLVFGGR
ncbi:MAG TPA: outer membrane beta-barrel protein [Vicinamibacterales bacterium]|nr:outer membrane beta-barrel protein [Vicinamibacterales bacterium]